MNRSGLPRDKDELLREVDLRIRLTDIRKLYETKSRLAPKWWEGLILLLLFAAALGLLASLVQYARSTGTIIDNWMAFWFGLMVMTVVFSFEFLLMKIYALRRANELAVRILEDLRQRQDAVEARLDEVAGIVRSLRDERAAGASREEGPPGPDGGTDAGLGTEA